MSKLKEKNEKIYRVRLDLAYDGSMFLGWQRQKDDDYTIQGVLEEKLSQIFKEKIHVQGSGRTDRGVHALHQVAHFDCSMDPRKIKLRSALQGLCPKFLVIKAVYLAPKEFHAQRSSLEKTYRYLIRASAIPSSQLWNKCTWVRRDLNLDYLNEISKTLVGKKDFKSFQNTGTDLKTTVREIYEAQWSSPKKGWIEFKIRGSGFLKQMVRNIVGTLLGLEQEQAKPERLQAIIDSQNRQNALKTAPPEGLYLVQVKYPQTLDNKCLKF